MSATRSAATGKPSRPLSWPSAAAPSAVPLTTSSTSGTAQCACTSTVRTRRPPTVTSRRRWLRRRMPHAAADADHAGAAAAWRRKPRRLSMCPPGLLISADGDRRDRRAGAALDLQRLHDEGELVWRRPPRAAPAPGSPADRCRAGSASSRGPAGCAPARRAAPRRSSCRRRSASGPASTSHWPAAMPMPAFARAVALVVLAHELRPAGADDDRVAGLQLQLLLARAPAAGRRA